MRHLSRSLTSEGHRVLRVYLNWGDSTTCRTSTRLKYRGKPENFQQWAAEQIEQQGVTDVLLYGDCRYYHQQVMALKERYNLKIWVLEEGYLRPSWVTLEQNGVNANSDIPKRFRTWLSQKPLKDFVPDCYEHPAPVGRGLRGLVFWCIVYYLRRFVGTPFYPHYRTHRPVSYLREGVAWLRKLAAQQLGRKRRSDELFRRLLAEQTPFFLIPLQLDADAQIRFHSPYKNIRAFIEEVMCSFAQHAPAGTMLVVKSHPLDSEVIDYRKVVANHARQLGIANRVLFLESGDIPKLLRHALGLVTVNSTVGLQSIHHGCPTKVMGRAIYDHSNMTAQCSLDAFWQQLPKPDTQQYKLFRCFLLEDCQINGNFYTIRGRKLLIPEITRRLTQG